LHSSTASRPGPRKHRLLQKGKLGFQLKSCNVIFFEE
jgi:hypothetical protein